MATELLAHPNGDTSRPQLFARRWPAQNPRGIVLVVHGFGEHSGRYQHVAAALNQSGHSCLGIDYRGFGRAGGRRAFVRRFDDYLDDVQWGLDECRRRSQHPPVLLGHSQGGLIAAAFAISRQPQLRSLALSSPALRFALEVPIWKRPMAQLLSPILPTLAIPAGIDARLLTHDPAMVQALRDDQLAHHKATVRWYTECCKAQRDLIERADDLSLPLLCLVAGSDHLVDHETTRAFFDRCRSPAKVWCEYQGAYHEVLNELAEIRQQVIDDLVAWLDGLGVCATGGANAECVIFVLQCRPETQVNP